MRGKNVSGVIEKNVVCQKNLLWRAKWVTIYLCILLLPALSGCNYLANYGQIGFLPDAKSNMSLRDLIDNCEHYQVYSGGSEGLFMALLFDPRDDGLSIVPKDWVKVDESLGLGKFILKGPAEEKSKEISSGYLEVDLKEKLRSIAVELETDPNKLSPFLGAIYGPDNRLFGYIYAPIGIHILIKAEAPNVLSIQNPIYQNDVVAGPSNLLN